MKNAIVSKNAPLYVAVYEIERCYGGPEEGGWWYDSGRVLGYYKLARSEKRAAPRNCPRVLQVRPDALRRIEKRAERDFGYLRVKPKNYRGRSSVIGGPDIELRFMPIVPYDYPQARPRYE